MKKILLVVLVMTTFLSLLPLTNGFAEQAEPLVKVKLVNYLGNKTEITLHPNGDYITSDATVVLKAGYTYLLKQVNGKLSLYQNGNLLYSSDTFSAQPTVAGSQLSINNRLYLGSFDFEVESNQFVRPINTISMEDYLKGVVPIEMYPFWNIEALKTQAVAARTYAMSYIKRGIVNDTISYQVYGGYVWTPNTTKAVDETKGLVAEYNGRLIDAVYSASNGGKTESNANAWGNNGVPYLAIKPDAFDPKTVWSFSFARTQIDLTGKDLANPSDWWTSTKEADTTIAYNIKMWLNNNGYADKDIKIISIPEFSLDQVGSGGRVSAGSIKIDFLVRGQVDTAGVLIPQHLSFANVSVSKVRSIIGNRTMLSFLVNEMDTQGDVVQVKGLGDGHGVGMSQWGAKYMADAGKNYVDILKFYYTGIDLVRLYDVSAPMVSESTNTDVSAQNQNHATTSTYTPVVKTGWLKENNKWYYIQPTGDRARGWLKDNSNWYYMNSNGEMLIGWVYVGGKWYYLASPGAMKTGWLLYNGKWYYLSGSGAMATGWIKDHEKWYYLSGSGAMVTGWIKDTNKWYYLEASGSMVKGRQYISGKWYLFDTSGSWIR